MNAPSEQVEKAGAAGAPEWRWSGANPIVGFAIILEFSAPFPPQVLEAVGQTHSQFRKDLPRRSEQRMLVMQFGAVGAAPLPRPQFAGFTFDRLKANGEAERSLTITANTLTYVVTSYSRWAEVWSVAKPILAVVADLLVADNPLAAIGLEYTDRFFWDGPRETARAGSLLAHSPFLAAHVFDCSDLWHCHHGFFRSDDEGSGRFLENVNLNCQDNEIEEFGNRRCLDVTVNHRFAFDSTTFLQPGLVFQEQNGVKGLEERLEAMHLRNKEILSSLLLSSLSAKIPGLENS